MNSRWVPMGFAIGPSLRGGLRSRALQGQAIVDASFAIAGRGDGTFDRTVLIGATIPQASAWIAGTVARRARGRRPGGSGAPRPRCRVPRVLPRAARRGGARPARRHGRGRGCGHHRRAHAGRARRPAGDRRLGRRGDRSAPDMTGAAWIVVAALCAGTVALKAVGPVTFGGRRLSPRRGRDRARRPRAARRPRRLRDVRRRRPGRDGRRARRRPGRGGGRHRPAPVDDRASSSSRR